MSAPGAAAAPGDTVEITAVAPVTEPLPFAGTGPVGTGNMIVAGFTLAETSGAAPASVEFWDGSAAGSIFLGRRNLLASESITDELPRVRCRTGVFVNVLAGAITGALYVEEQAP